MLSFRVVTILSTLFALASLMPGKKFLVETDDADGATDPDYHTDPDFESYLDELMKEYPSHIPRRAPRRGLNKGQPRCGTCNNPGGNPNTPRPMRDAPAPPNKCVATAGGTRPAPASLAVMGSMSAVDARPREVAKENGMENQHIPPRR